MIRPWRRAASCCALVLRILLLLLLALLLELPLPFLHFFNHLLLSANRDARGVAVRSRRGLRRRRRLLRLRLLRYLFGPVVFIVGLAWVDIAWTWRAPSADGEDNAARRALALVADHEDVVTGAVKKLKEHVTRRSGAVRTEYPLILAKAFDLDARIY